ncbi:hypothetical protein [Lentilactobacillus otakiensis]|uniref:hypothetical protein n=1 Tax=Lentilactobacillus otakiensis TaxID=481720 RepID=UPI003D186CAF
MKKLKLFLLAIASFALLFAFSDTQNVDAKGTIPSWYLGNWKAVNGHGVYVGIRKSEVLLEVKDEEAYWKPVTWTQDPYQKSVIFGTGYGNKHSKFHFLLMKQKIQGKPYMVMTMKKTTIYPKDLKKHPMIMTRY